MKSTTLNIAHNNTTQKETSMKMTQHLEDEFGGRFDTAGIGLAVAEFLYEKIGTDPRWAHIAVPHYEASVIDLATDLGLDFDAVLADHELPVDEIGLARSVAAHPAGRKIAAAAVSV